MSKQSSVSAQGRQTSAARRQIFLGNVLFALAATALLMGIQFLFRESILGSPLFFTFGEGRELASTAANSAFLFVVTLAIAHFLRIGELFVRK